MKKSIPIILLIVMLTMTTVMAESINTTGTSIDLSSAINPTQHSHQASTYHYVIGSSTVYRYNYDWTSPSLIFSTASLNYFDTVYNTFSGAYNHLTRDSPTNIKQRDISFGNIQTINMNSFTPVEYSHGSIKDLETDTVNNQIAVLDNDFINVYNIAWDLSGFFSPSFAYQIDLGSLDLGTTLNMEFYQETLYIYDKTNQTIYRTNRVGDVIQVFEVSDNGRSLYDLFFYNDSLYIMALSPEEALEYDANIIIPPTVVDGVAYDAQSCTGNYVNKPYAEFTSNLCSNISYNINAFGEVFLTCEDQYTTYCPTGCTQTTNDIGTISSGECNPVACTNECDIINKNTCTTENTYRQCVTGVDGCLDLVGEFYCPLGQYCSNGQCDAITINKTGLWTQEYIRPSHTLNTTSAYDVYETTTNAIVDVTTTATESLTNPTTKFISQYFLKSFFNKITTKVRVSTVETPSTLTSETITAVSCDFTNNLLEADYLNHNNPSQHDWTTTENVIKEDGVYYLELNNTSNTTKELDDSSITREIEIMYKPVTDGTTSIHYLDDNKKVGELEITYNNTLKNIVVKDVVYNKILVNDTSLQVSDDLQRIVIVSRHLHNIKSTHYELLVIRKPSTEEVISRSYSLPIQYTQTTSVNPNKIVFSPDNEGRIYHVINKEQDGYPAYTTNASITTDEHSCEYITTGCRNVRVFANTLNTPTYHFYEDLQSCPSQLGTTTDKDLVSEGTDQKGVVEEIANTEFSTRTKLLIAILVTAGVFAIFFFLSASVGDNSVMIVGTILSGLLLIYFSVIGYIPFWSIIVLAIIGAGFVAMGAKQLVRD